MKNRVHAVVLLLAVVVSACDTEGVIEPVLGDVALSVVPVSDKVAVPIPEKTILIDQVIGDAEGVAQLYHVAGLIRYTMVRAPGVGPLCQGYAIHSIIEGMVSPLKNDQVLWTFQGNQTESICMGSSPYALSITCPLEGREDGALLRINLMVTASGMQLDDVSIETQGSDITPVGS